MKKLVPNITAFFLVLFLLVGCSHTKLPGSSVNATVKTGENYVYEIGQFGFEEGASIEQQAMHYTSSEVKRNGSMMVYRYRPTAGYTGHDKVVIKTNKGSIGDGTGGKESYITIHLAVVR